MKIKYDFVTNSSSVAYIVMIPNNFYVSDDEIKKKYDEKKLYEDEDCLAKLEEVIKEVPKCMRILKEGDNIWYYGNNGVNQTVFDTVCDICYDNAFSITSMGISSEGNNIIQGVKEEVIENMIVSNIDIMSIFKSIQRGNEIDTSKIK